MTKNDLKGTVILMNELKELIQTKRCRICQRDKLTDRIHFLIPLAYNYEDLTQYTVMLVYRGQDLTPHMEKLIRLSDGYGGYENYVDKDGNETHMIYILDVDSQLTQIAGDITLQLSLQYVDYESQTESPDDEHDSPTPPSSTQHVINTQSTIITVYSVTDYYSIVTDESLSMINNYIAKLDEEAKKLNQGKADNIALNADDNSLYLTSEGRIVGDKIDLNDLGDAVSDDTESGLVKVIT